MIRHSIFLSIGFLVGCSTPPEGLRHISTLHVQTKGVSLNHSGAKAYVGMLGMACGIDVDSASITQDMDPSEEEERVEDSSDTLEHGSAVLTSNSEGVHRIGTETREAETMAWATPEISATHISGARLLTDGIVALSAAENGCVLTRTFEDGSTSSSVIDPAICDKDSQLDIIDDEQWIVYGQQGLLVVDGMEARKVAERAEYARSSADGSLLWYTHQNTATVIDLSGTVLETITMDGSFTSLDRIGSTGQFAVTMNAPGGARYGQLNDKLEWVTTQPIPETSSISISGNGRVISFILPDAVHFYETLVRQ